MSCSRAFFALVVFTTAALPVWSANPCAQCHAKEVAGFSATAMAHSLSSPIPQTSGTFLHGVSNSRFTIRSDGDRTIQHLERHGASADYRVAYIIGSGTHAFGYLVQVGDHLFQSPIPITRSVGFGTWHRIGGGSKAGFRSPDHGGMFVLPCRAGETDSRNFEPL